MIAAILPVLAQIGLKLIELYIEKKQIDKESRILFIRVAEELRRLGAQNVKSRYESETQIDEIESEWNKKENNQN